jgi:hypothetical protein
MPRKPKRTFSAAKAVRAIARERIGTPPAARVIPDRRKPQREKHKKDPLLEGGE